MLEFDFTVVVKKGTTHQRADHLSRITNGEAPNGVDDDLPDAYLFNIEMVPRWSQKMIPFFITNRFICRDKEKHGKKRTMRDQQNGFVRMFF